MTPEQLQKKISANEVQFVQPEIPAPPPIQPVNHVDEYQGLLDTLRRPKSYLTAAPTFTPKGFLDQIQFYDDGTNRRLYLYINNAWRYVALT